MQFRFDADQEHQVQAIESVADLFEGQPFVEAALAPLITEGVGAVANWLDLPGDDLLANLRAVQARNGLPPDDALQYIEEEVATAAGPATVRFPNFSVEMETGTGKTYVYLRTALELCRRYGLRKFIVVVPSVAIREGVLKTLQVTRTHFRDLYDNLPYRYYAYDSTNLTRVREFALGANVEIMVMTIAAFNKASNVIHQSTDRLMGETPVHLIQATRPVLILDEPQNMESELSRASLAVLNPQFALRYSATHRNPYNLVYRLTPFDAYRQGLVKRVEVASVVGEHDETQAFVRVDAVQAQRRTVIARVAVHKLMADGTVKEQVVTVRPGDALREKTGRPEYAGYEVDEIDCGLGVVRFANGVEIRVGESRGADREAVFAAQIRYTIEEHFRKQARLRDLGVKVLSLFFIDRVANYAPEDGVIRRLFREAFDDLKERYPEWRGVDPERVQAAYFAQQRRRTGEVDLLDSSTGESQRDEAAYELIMRDKERLLSFEEPVAFIFSHSALREGWDNPNVFQVCTLNQTASEIKKRQEVGRGIRLCVDQAGQRVHDPQVNVLTVVANEAYERYVAQYQAEIEEAYGAAGTPPPPPNARQKRTVRLRKAYLLRPEFQELWERIKHRTRYAVRIDTARLVDEVVAALDAEVIRPPAVTVTKARVEVGTDAAFTALQMSAAKRVADLAGRFPLPNLVDTMTHLLEHATPPVRLTRRTLLEIVRRTRNQRAAMDNPHEFATVAVRIIRERLADQFVDGIRYERTSEWYEMSQFDVEFERWEQHLVPAERALYDHVEYDSEVERAFVQGLEERDDVLLYVKLPAWFTVPTPIGAYNPDWAIVMEERDEHGTPTGNERLYLVRETKGATWQTDLRPDERRKIDCGARHFALLDVDYRVVSSVDELP